jgi:hypothetical protein
MECNRSLRFSTPQFAPTYLLGDQLRGAGVDLRASRGAQLPDQVIHVGGHDCLYHLPAPLQNRVEAVIRFLD